MKAKHIFSGMNYRQLDALKTKFPFLNLDKIKAHFGGWKEIPQEKRNEIARFLKEKYRNENN